MPAGAPPTQAAAPPVAVPVPPGAAGEGGPTGSLPVYSNASAMSKIFNPDIAVIGNFVGAGGKNSINPTPAFGLDEAEATFQAVVDPYARADFFLSFSPEGVEIEEGFLTLTSLPGGLLAKVGKLKEQVGKVNTLHSHSLPWVDKPLDGAKPFRRRGRHRGFRRLGLEADPQSDHVPRGNRRSLCRHVGPLPVVRAQRRQLGRTAARLSRRHRVDEHRRRRVDRLWARTTPGPTSRRD